MPFNDVPDIQMKKTDGGDRMIMAGKTNEDKKIQKYCNYEIWDEKK